MCICMGISIYIILTSVLLCVCVCVSQRNIYKELHPGLVFTDFCDK